jgi:cohesin complex subunit SA-1/2
MDMSSDVEHDGASSSRRKSGRAVKKPQLFSKAVHSIGLNNPEKRKRNTTLDDGQDDDDDGEEEDEDEESDSEDDDDDDDADSEEEKERRKVARKVTTKRKALKKPNAGPKRSRAAKKPKINGAGKSLAIRPATNGRQSKKPAPKKRTAPSRPIFRAIPEGLYSMSFFFTAF